MKYIWLSLYRKLKFKILKDERITSFYIELEDKRTHGHYTLLKQKVYI